MDAGTIESSVFTVMPFSPEFYAAANTLRPQNAMAGYFADAQHPVNRLVHAVRTEPILRCVLDFPQLQDAVEADATEAYTQLQQQPWSHFWCQPTFPKNTQQGLTAQDLASILGNANVQSRLAVRHADHSTKSDTIITAVALLVATACSLPCRAQLGNPTSFFAKLMGCQDIRLERLAGFKNHFRALNGKSLNASGGGNHRLVAASVFNRFALGLGRSLGMSPIEHSAGIVTETIHPGTQVDQFFDSHLIIIPGEKNLVRWTPHGPRTEKCAPESLQKLRPHEGVEQVKGGFVVNTRKLEMAACALRPQSLLHRLTETWPIFGNSERISRRQFLEFMRSQL